MPCLNMAEHEHSCIIRFFLVKSDIDLFCSKTRCVFANLSSNVLASRQLKTYIDIIYHI